MDRLVSLHASFHTSNLARRKAKTVCLDNVNIHPVALEGTFEIVRESRYWAQSDADMNSLGTKIPARNGESPDAPLTSDRIHSAECRKKE